MRCAGFDRVDVKACEQAGIAVARVPTYSPASVAEHAVAMLLCLNRYLSIHTLKSCLPRGIIMNPDNVHAPVRLVLRGH